jgi:hypothetical protein
MRTVEYQRHEYHGEPEAVAAPLWAFVYDVPYLAICGVFPPLHILNQVLAAGGSPGGMGPGATWTPFEISADEYRTMLPLVLEPDRTALAGWARYPDQRMFLDPDLDHIKDHLDWVRAAGARHRDAARPGDSENE